MGERHYRSQSSNDIIGHHQRLARSGPETLGQAPTIHYRRPLLAADRVTEDKSAKLHHRFFELFRGPESDFLAGFDVDGLAGLFCRFEVSTCVGPETEVQAFTRGGLRRPLIAISSAGRCRRHRCSQFLRTMVSLSAPILAIAGALRWMRMASHTARVRATTVRMTNKNAHARHRSALARRLRCVIRTR